MSSRVGALLALILIAAGLAGGGYYLYRELSAGQNDPVSAAATADREDFLRIVRKNADDPAGLEIVEWGDLYGKNRSVTFRCRCVGLLRTGRLKTPGGPVSLEQATAEYDGRRIVRLHLSKTYQVWHAD